MLRMKWGAGSCPLLMQMYIYDIPDIYDIVHLCPEILLNSTSMIYELWFYAGVPNLNALQHTHFYIFLDFRVYAWHKFRR